MIRAVGPEDFVHEALEGGGSSKQNRTAVLRIGVIPNGVVKAVFSWIVAIRGSANTLSLNPVLNNSVPHLTDQATRQLGALDKRRTSTWHSPSCSPHRTGRSRPF